MVIEYIAFTKGINSFREYAVLGDDVVIWNEMVANGYEEFMSTIGVPINRNKSIISTPEIQSIEFAKRLVHDGEEISGLRFQILDQVATQLLMWPDLARVCHQRD